jgi:hypothetical protein
MNARRFIPMFFAAVAVFFVRPRQDDACAQQPVEYAPMGPYFVQPAGPDCSEPKPMFVQPDGTWIQPAGPIEMVPLVPLPPSASPRPGVLPGPMFAPPPAEVPSPAAPLAGIAPGGAISPQFGLPAGPDNVQFANPILVPVVDDQLAWEQIADVVSDYFTIAREQQARRSGEAWMEGRIETAFQGGATVLEPFRHDSVGSFNRWESTFQTIRRSAVIRVIPDQNGYLVEVVVQKEIEDLPRPERATAGAATFRTDGSLPTNRANEVSRILSSPRWLPLGRDPALEARMLADIHARLTGVTISTTPSLLP